MLDESTGHNCSFQQLADARRVLKVTNSLRKAPVLLAEERAIIEHTPAFAIRCIEAATEELIATLDALYDPDVEPNGDELDGISLEEDIPSESALGMYMAGPGCALADVAEDDDPAEESEPAELNGDEGDYGGEVCGI